MRFSEQTKAYITERHFVGRISLPITGVRAGTPRTDPEHQTIIWDINPKQTALLVVDMINCFVDPAGEIYVPGIEKTIPNINRLAEFCRSVGCPVVWIREYVKNYPNDWLPYFAMWNLRPKNALGPEAGMLGTMLHSSMVRKKEDFEVIKYRYSPFAPNSPSTPSLDKLLRAQGIETVIIVGTNTNVCCESTARDAMHLDYKVVFVSDATSTFNNKMHEATLDTIRLAFGMVCTTDELIEEMSAPAKTRPQVASVKK
jgi:ureidoacrylate peracid hydrolase